MSYLRRWEPLRNLMTTQSDLDRVLEDFFGRPPRSDEATRAPGVDISETASEVVVEAELPGVDKKDLDVEVLPESLSLRAEMSQEKEEKEEKEETYHRRERVWRHYERLLPLPAEVQTDQVKAVLRDGVMEVRMPKTERSKTSTPRTVAVE